MPAFFSPDENLRFLGSLFYTLWTNGHRTPLYMAYNIVGRGIIYTPWQIEKVSSTRIDAASYEIVIG